MRRFLPCLSYPIHEIDPGRDSRRDRGEELLCKLRPLLHAAAKTTAMQKLLDPAHPSSLAALLSPGDASADQWSVAERANIIESVLNSSDANKPCAALVQTTVRTLRSREVDALDEAGTVACVPVRRSDLVCMPGLPPKGKTPSSVVVTWPKHTFAIAKGATRSATLKVDRLDKQGVQFTIEAADGVRHENLIAKDVPASLLDALFAPGDAVVHPAVALSELAANPRLPTSAGELPEQLQLQLAGFLQIRLRAHVLAAAAGPLDATRPLWFENFTLKWESAGEGRQPRMVVKGYLHSCSATCFCGAHALPDPAARWKSLQFTGKQTAVVTLQMCGSHLKDGRCPTHGAGCAKNEAFADGYCCANAGVSFACRHEYKGAAANEKPIGTHLRCDLTHWAHKELTLLLAICGKFDRRARPLLGADAPDDARARLTRLVLDTTRYLDRKVEAFDTMQMRDDRGATTDADLARLDALALARLREGGLVRAKPPMSGPPKPPRLIFPKDSTCKLRAHEAPLNKPPHVWLFPRHDQPYGRRVIGGTAVFGMADEPATADGGVASEPSELVDVASEPTAKRACTEDSRYAYQSLTEYYSVQGLQSLRTQLDAIMANPDLPERQQRRGLHFAQFLNALENELGPEVDGPLGLPCRALVCKYRARNDGGRLYPTGMQKIVNCGDGEARSVCTQSAPRETRPFFCAEFAHDYDMKNAQPMIMLQMAKKLTWADNRSAAPMPHLEAWCSNRPEFIEHVAEVHRLPPDAERFVEYRKDLVKELCISLLFGGSYGRWIEKLCDAEGRRADREPRSPRVEGLAKELAQLRKDVFESKEWISFVEKDRARLRAEGEKEDDDSIDRSVMARVAQKEENRVLDAMRASVTEQGFTCLTLCFDGLHVQHRPRRVRDLAAMQARITTDTGYVIEVVEKPLFSTELPTLSLARS